jgi:hypothetical protein
VSHGLGRVLEAVPACSGEGMGAIFRCDEIEKRASAAIDRELSFVEGLRFRAHLAICRACRGHLSQLRRSVELLRSASREEPAPHAEALVVAALARRGREEDQR